MYAVLLHISLNIPYSGYFWSGNIVIICGKNFVVAQYVLKTTPILCERTLYYTLCTRASGFDLQFFVRGSPLDHENHQNITSQKIPAIRYASQSHDTLSLSKLHCLSNKYTWFKKPMVLSNIFTTFRYYSPGPQYSRLTV